MAHEAIKTVLHDMHLHATEFAAHETNPISRKVAYFWLMDRFSKTKSQVLFTHKLDEKLTDAAWYYVQEQMKIVMCEKDLAAANWVAKLLSENDWLNRSEYGEETGRRLALLVARHYDHEFVETISWRMERLSLTNETSNESLALVKQHLHFTNAQTASLIEEFGQNVGPAFMCH